MKKFFFSVAALAAAVTFTACSSEDVIEQSQASPWNADGTGYLAFNIALPQTTASRANDNYDKGEDSEYAVKDVILLLFSGENFHSAYDLTNGESWGTGVDGNVTVDKKYVAKIEDGPTNPKAFVVVNTNGIFNVDKATHSLSVNGTPFLTGHTFAELQALTKTTLSLNASEFANPTGGILMSNAPLFTSAGEDQQPIGSLNVLVDVLDNNTYKTEEEAKKGTHAVSIYVERAVAKVSVKQGDSFSTPAAFGVELNGWTLDNTNKSSYLLRSIEDFGTWKDYYANGLYRMVGSKNVGHAQAITQGTRGRDGYRTYFAKDVNYNVDAVFGDSDPAKNTFNSVANLDDAVAMGKYQYCAENTFDVEHMTYKNTTRAIIKATITPSADSDKINGGNNFYSKPGDDKFYSASQMMNLMQNYVNDELKKLLDAGKIEFSGTIGYNITAESNFKSFNVKVTTPITKKSTLEAAEADFVDKLVSTDGASLSIHKIGYDYYEGGVCYYETRIKHFGDDHTPWHITTDATDIATAYPGSVADRDNAYLGRWGVLRNNWYEIEVNSVKKIGYAHPENLSFDPNTPEDLKNPDPEYGETPDDNQKSELWLAIDVNILSWAKRAQPTDF